MALRGYYSSPRHDEPYIESHLDIRDRDGAVVPGYGWIFPMGDGRVNVGVGILSTADRWKNINTTKLMDAFVAQAAASWCLEPRHRARRTDGRKAADGPVRRPARRARTTSLSATPADRSTRSTAKASPTATRPGAWPPRPSARRSQAAIAHSWRASKKRLQDEYGLYYKVASSFMRMMGRPELMRALVGTGMYSRSLMGWLLRIMSNLLREDEQGPAEVAYRAAARDRAQIRLSKTAAALDLRGDLLCRL